MDRSIDRLILDSVTSNILANPLWMAQFFQLKSTYLDREWKIQFESYTFQTKNTYFLFCEICIYRDLVVRFISCVQLQHSVFLSSSKPSFNFVVVGRLFIANGLKGLFTDTILIRNIIYTTSILQFTICNWIYSENLAIQSQYIYIYKCIYEWCVRLHARHCSSIIGRVIRVSTMIIIKCVSNLRCFPFRVVHFVRDFAVFIWKKKNNFQFCVCVCEWLCVFFCFVAESV